MFRRLRGAARCLGRGVDLRERQPRMVEESLARCSQFDATRTAAEQFRADFVFQIADLSAKRWLRRVQTLFGRNREAARLRDGNEIPQMSKSMYSSPASYAS